MKEITFQCFQAISEYYAESAWKRIRNQAVFKNNSIHNNLREEKQPC